MKSTQIYFDVSDHLGKKICSSDFIPFPYQIHIGLFPVKVQMTDFYGADFIQTGEGVPLCPVCGGLVKPDVVLYEEGLDQDTVEGAVRAIARADVLIVGGTSLVVYPAAGLIDYYQGRKLVLINRDPTPYDGRADLVIHDSIGKVLGGIEV